jgi:RNA polymerase sigma-70 factor (ECF subfamily)
MKEGELPDRRLVKEMLEGNEQAFERFFAEYFPGLYRFALARLDRDKAAAEEVVQSAMCKAVSKLNTYRGEAALFTWLCTICRNEIWNYLNARKHEYFPAGIDNDPEIVAALESLLITSKERPDHAALRHELAAFVQTALNALPSHYADVLEWKYIDGLPVKEIAAKLNLGSKAAESLLTRARIAFRDAFCSLSSGEAWPSYILKNLGTEKL